jgi:CTP synthase
MKVQHISREFNGGSKKMLPIKGGTMRFGTWKCTITPNSLAQHLQTNGYFWRHRHHYEYNSAYVAAFKSGTQKHQG